MIQRAALMCHAPIVIPQIAGARGESCRATTLAMRKCADFLVSPKPDLTVVLTPHGSRTHDWRIHAAPELQGSFAPFGRTDLQYLFTGAPAVARELKGAMGEAGLSAQLWEAELDHGALVPLHFLSEVGFSGPLLVLHLPFPDDGSAEAAGRTLHALAQQKQQRWALLASGDMSHRLIPGAPAGYDVRATDFDAYIVDALGEGKLQHAVNPPRDLRELAAEDVVQSLAVVNGAVQGHPQGLQLLHYEGPFGVGYCEALLHDQKGATNGVPLATASFAQHAAPPQALVTIARESIAASAEGRTYTPEPLGDPWQRARPVFVTLREPNGELRGCIGTLDAKCPNLSAQVADTARSAAMADPRFPPVRESEVPRLQVEISVLEPPEPITSLQQLNPDQYGVVVRSGDRRGVLLPNVPGIEDARQQVQVAKRKAGIQATEPVQLERFLVRKVVGSEAPAS